MKNSTTNEYFCWHGRDNDLKRCIRKSKFVKNIRDSLTKKKFDDLFKESENE
jgi:hypothetical protein